MLTGTGWIMHSLLSWICAWNPAAQRLVRAGKAHPERGQCYCYLLYRYFAGLKPHRNVMQSLSYTDDYRWPATVPLQTRLHVSPDPVGKQSYRVHCPQPYVPLLKTRPKKNPEKPYSSLIWPSFEGGGCTARGGIGLYDISHSHPHDMPDRSSGLAPPPQCSKAGDDMIYIDRA